MESLTFFELMVTKCVALSSLKLSIDPLSCWSGKHYLHINLFLSPHKTKLPITIVHRLYRMQWDRQKKKKKKIT